jgi:hypothetical protein
VYVAFMRASIAVVVAALVITAPDVAAAESKLASTSKPDYQGTGVIVGLHPPPSSLHATRPVGRR